MGKYINQSKTILSKNWRVFIRSGSDVRSEFLAPIILTAVVCCQKLSSTYGYFLTASIIAPVVVSALYRKITISLVNEKAMRYRETQKIVGLSGQAYLTGWLLFYYLRSMIVSLVFVIGLLICNDAYQLLSLGQVILSYVLSNMATVSFNFMLTSFFQTPQFACDLCGLIQVFFPFLPFFLTESSPSWVYYLMGLLPQSCLALVFQVEINPEVRAHFSVEQSIYQQLFNMFFWLLLFLYLDQVIPNDFGIRKHPLFFIKDLFSSKHKTEQQESLLKSHMEQQEVCSAKFYQEYQGECQSTIQIRGLVKQYGALRAVDGISLDLFRSQILCLLGHNGAGKTTTISMLTGLVQSTGGQVTVNGLDLNKDIDQIRQSTGLCSQKDILYDTLTVQEHLYFVGQIKQVPTSRLEKEVQEITEKCGLTHEKHKKAGILSGGFKRKLSLAMSLMGDSQVVYLDEPTSGLDPVSRQSIWGILDGIRQENRTIILTTHFLDEAERLADRIAIMSRGQLLAMGSNDFIKKKFGEGYQLTVSPADQSQAPSQECKDQLKESIDHVLSHTEGSKIVENTQQSDSQTLLVPFSQTSLFPELCQFIEQRSLVNLSFSLNTLEDAFIKIGLEEDKYLGVKEEQVENQHDFRKQRAPPACLQYPPQRIFYRQLGALLLRKVYITYRNLTLVLSYCFPTMLAIVGVVVCRLVIDKLNSTFAASIIFNNVLGFAYCLNTSIFICTSVMEKEQRLKYALNVMGCGIRAYWLASFIFDYVLYLVTLVVLVVVLEAEQLTFVTNNMAKFFMAMAVYGIALIPLSYVWGFAFSKKNTAVKLYPIVLYVGFYSIPWACVNGFSSVSEFASHFCEVLFIVVSPPFCWSRSLIVFYDGADLLIKPKPAIGNYYLLVGILAIQAVLLCALTLYLDYKSQKVSSGAKVQQTAEQSLGESQIVAEDKQLLAEEQQRVQTHSKDYPVCMQDIYKTYQNGFAALKGVSVGVKEGEVLGLLGPNGAGKSTSFNVLTGAEGVSAGKVSLKNQEIVSQHLPVFSDVGICPQTDCVWEYLTPVEHLVLFGRLKGLYGVDLHETVDYFIEVLQLRSYTKTKAGQLSGGNRRKLCVGLAQMGGPGLLFFDEPSTGLDPIAKRFLWASLQNVLGLKASSMVLTTHSMEEAETLCDRLAILVNGTLLCLDTLQGLRSKYGGGFNVIMVSKQPEQVMSKLQQHFHKVQLIPSAERTLHYQITQEQFQYSAVFRLLNEMQAQGIVEDYSVTCSSLDQIFQVFYKFHKFMDQLLL